MLVRVHVVVVERWTWGRWYQHIVISVKGGAGRRWETRPTGETDARSRAEVERCAMDNDRAP